MKTRKLLPFLCLIPMAALFILACSSGQDNFRRQKMAIQIKSEIENYYKENGFYPASLAALPISKNKEFVSYYKGGVFHYTSHKGDKAWYHFIWVYDGILEREDGDHRLSWSGKQCGNDRANLRLLSEDSQPDSNGFYEIDLH